MHWNFSTRYSTQGLLLQLKIHNFFFLSVKNKCVFCLYDIEKGLKFHLYSLFCDLILFCQQRRDTIREPGLFTVSFFSNAYLQGCVFTPIKRYITVFTPLLDYTNLVNSHACQIQLKNIYTFSTPTTNTMQWSHHYIHIFLLNYIALTLSYT